MRRFALALLVALVAIVGRVAAAQEVRGTVRDSANGQPIPGAVVVLRDAAGNTLSRNITGERGQFRIVPPANGGRFQFLRLGFRPREMAVPQLASGVTQLDVALVYIPTLLERVRVVASATCPRRPDRAAALALFDQAQAGLLATVVERETNPATVTRLAFDRTMDVGGDRIVSQRVRMESADRATVSFNAARTAIDFARKGFMADDRGQRTFYGPDADVLLDEGFARAYCFHLADTDGARPNQIGLGFAPSGRRGGRVDISGTLWIDTVARTLKDLEFRYLGLDQLSEGFRSGGWVSFREVSRGVVLIDRWSLRLVGAADTVMTGRNGATVHQGYVIREVGGELARAAWADGRRWTASLGTLQVSAVSHQGAAAVGTVVGLLDTDYRATADSGGTAQVNDLVPGPYTVIVIDPRLATLGIALPTPLSFVAARDSTVALRLDVPTSEEFVAESCRSDGRANTSSAWLIARVTTADGHTATGARWRVNKQVGAGWSPVAEGGATGSTGLLHFCSNLAIGDVVQIQFWLPGGPPDAVVQRLSQKLTVARLQERAVASARGRDARTSKQLLELRGTVTDTVSGVAVPEASVELLEASRSALTDATGRFTISDVPRGEYTVEVRTPSLDSLGAVHRSVLLVGDSAAVVELHVPTANQIAAAMCGVGPADAPDLSGVVVGRVGMRGDFELPADVRVVAEWNAPPSATNAGFAGASTRTHWRKARADARGTFRLCGVPVDAALLLRAEVDSTINAGAVPVEVRIRANERFARADLALEVGVDVGGVFAGIVVTDSTDRPIADAEVVLPALKRNTLTNDQGGFRMSGIPAGMHLVQVRRLGFAPVTAQVAFGTNQAIDHRIALRPVTTIAAVEVTASSAVSEFESNRKLGLGRYLTRADLEKYAGRQLQQALAGMATINLASGRGGHAWLIGKRAPVHVLPGPGSSPAPGGGQPGDPNPGCGTGAGASSPGSMSSPNACSYNDDDLRRQGFYCPVGGEVAQGIDVQCACYAQVYVDGKLMNRDRPTEPFDVNTIAPDAVEGVEWYASASQTPSRYSSLNATCGVMSIWTRRSR